MEDDARRDLPTHRPTPSISDPIKHSDLIDQIFPYYIVLSEGVETPALKIAQSAADNFLLYRFLKSVVRFYNIGRDPNKHSEIIHRLKVVIDTAGMIS